MKTAPHHSTGRFGFTLLEVLVSVSLVAILATLGIAAVHHQTEAADGTKLRQQVKSLNAAVQTYQLAGGDLSGSTSIHDVLTKLKSYAPDGQSAQIAGIRESLIDPRLVALPMTPDQIAGDNPRVIWDDSSNRFALVSSGSSGSQEFAMDDLAVAAEDSGARKLSTKLATRDDWIWDYKDRSEGGSSIEGEEASDDGDVQDFVTESNPSSDPTNDQLNTPEFSIPSGEWNYPEFEGLNLTLDNPNPDGSSILYYAVNNGPWTIYTGSINVGPNQEIQAYAQSLDPVSYLDSELAMENYTMVPVMFSGETSGEFEGATGADEMEIDYYVDGETSIFEWGEARPHRSSLSFTGSSFSNIAAGQLFDLGILDYFNGTISAGSEAWNVGLSLEIEFNTPEITELFDFSFDLNNTVNYGNSADEDADFVTITNPLSNFQTQLNGIEYALQLQFGYEGDDGFATVDEFHVHEGSDATANIYGIFVEVDEYGNPIG